LISEYYMYVLIDFRIVVDGERYAMKSNDRVDM